MELSINLFPNLTLFYDPGEKPGLKIMLTLFAKQKYPDWINGGAFEQKESQKDLSNLGCQSPNALRPQWRSKGPSMSVQIIPEKK